jgi:hypothetical protein
MKGTHTLNRGQLEGEECTGHSPFSLVSQVIEGTICGRCPKRCRLIAYYVLDLAPAIEGTILGLPEQMRP